MKTTVREWPRPFTFRWTEFKVFPRLFQGKASRFSLKHWNLFYVSLGKNVRFPLRKRMFLGRETYVSATGNVKNIEKKPPLRRDGFTFYYS